MREFQSLKLRACEISSDCQNGFYCNNNDCIAKKKEGSFCFSGDDEECACGKCIINTETWEQVCYNDNGKCYYQGINFA